MIHPSNRSYVTLTFFILRSILLFCLDKQERRVLSKSIMKLLTNYFRLLSSREKKNQSSSSPSSEVKQWYVRIFLKTQILFHFLSTQRTVFILRALRVDGYYIAYNIIFYSHPKPFLAVCV